MRPMTLALPQPLVKRGRRDPESVQLPADFVVLTSRRAPSEKIAVARICCAPLKLTTRSVGRTSSETRRGASFAPTGMP